MIQAMGVSRERVYICNVMTSNAANSGNHIEATLSHYNLKSWWRLVIMPPRHCSRRRTPLSI